MMLERSRSTKVSVRYIPLQGAVCSKRGNCIVGRLSMGCELSHFKHHFVRHCDPLSKRTKLSELRVLV